MILNNYAYKTTFLTDNVNNLALRTKLNGYTIITILKSVDNKFSNNTTTTDLSSNYLLKIDIPFTSNTSNFRANNDLSYLSTNNISLTIKLSSSKIQDFS